MVELNEVLIPPEKNHRLTVTDIAAIAGVSRGTIYAVRRNPDGSTLATLRRVLRAMGYDMVIKLVKIEET